MENQEVKEPAYQMKRQVRYAGFWIRVGASLVDFLAFIPLIALNMYNMYVLKSMAIQLVLSLLMMAYKPLMEFKYGATLGKMAVKIQVVNLEFKRINIDQAMIRYVPWLIGGAISLLSTFLLFKNQEFLNSSDWMVVGQIQQNLLPAWVGFINPIIMLATIITVAINAKKQGLHDMMAKTFCIYKEEE